jgi:hypothetical protein
MATTKSTKGTKAQKVQASEVHQTLEAVKDLDLNTVIGEVGNLTVSVNNTLAGLSAALTSKIQQMETVDSAIGLKQNRLNELFGIEDQAVSIDDLRAQREDETKEWERKLAERNARWVEEDAEREKFRKRETEEYLYSTKQHQRRIREDFESEIANQKREEKIRQELLKREWDIRQETLSIQEQDNQNLRDTVATIDSRIKGEVTKAEAILSNTLKKHYEHEIAMIRKDGEAAARMSAAQANMQQSTINGLVEQIKDLQVQLASARNDMKDIVSDAFGSVSQKQVAEALTKVVDQNKNEKNSRTTH